MNPKGDENSTNWEKQLVNNTLHKNEEYEDEVKEKEITAAVSLGESFMSLS